VGAPRESRLPASQLQVRPSLTSRNVRPKRAMSVLQPDTEFPE